jgi:hypothetical protein
MRCGRREYLCDLTQKNFEIRSWSAAVTVAMSATGASAMACYGGQRASSFQNTVTVLHLETKLKLYNYMQTQLFPRYCARCGFEPTRLSTRRRCTRHQCRLAASSLSLRSHAAPVSPPRPWPLTRTGRSTPASRARCQPTEAQATGKSPRAEHPVMPGVSSVHPEVRRLLPHWQAFSIDERQVRARHTPNGNAPQLCLLPRI